MNFVFDLAGSFMLGTLLIIAFVHWVEAIQIGFDKISKRIKS